MDRTIPSHITGLYLFTIINLLALFHVTLVTGEINVMDTVKNVTIATYDDMPALFGSSLPIDGIKGVLVYVTPHNACSPVDGPPKDVHNSQAWIALIAREGCDFAEKILNAQKAGYSVGIVHNKEGDESLVPMSSGSHGRDVNIPSVFVGYSTGMNMADKFNYKNRNVILSVDGEIPLPNYKIYLWPFAIVVGTCFCLMLIFMLIKWCRDRRRRNRSRLSTKHLKKIPIKKFKKGDNYDVCAICLDDYEEGEKLRILPCNHSYHRKCIDPWLTKNRKTCPICKRRVIPGEENESDSDTDAEGGTTTTTTNERTPLLSNQSPSSSRTSTFDRSGLPEAVRTDVTTLHHENDQDSDSVNSLQGAVGQTLIQVEERSQKTLTSSNNSVTVADPNEPVGAVGGNSEEPPKKKRDKKRDPSQTVGGEQGAVGIADHRNVDAEKPKKSRKTRSKPSSSKNKSKKPKTKASASAPVEMKFGEGDTEALLPREDNSTALGADNPSAAVLEEEGPSSTQDITTPRTDNSTRSRNTSPGGASNHGLETDDVNFTTESRRAKSNQIV